MMRIAAGRVKSARFTTDAMAFHERLNPSTTVSNTPPSASPTRLGMPTMKPTIGSHLSRIQPAAADVWTRSAPRTRHGAASSNLALKNSQPCAWYAELSWAKWCG